MASSLRQATVGCPLWEGRRWLGLGVTILDSGVKEQHPLTIQVR